MPPYIDGPCEVLSGSMKLKTGFVKSESEKFTVKKVLCRIQAHITPIYHALDNFYTLFYAMPS